MSWARVPARIIHHKSNWQFSYSSTFGIVADERAGKKVRLELLKAGIHVLSNSERAQDLRTYLKNAWGIKMSRRKDGSEIEVIGQYHGPVCVCLSQDGLVGGIRNANFRPMLSDVMRLKDLCPLRAEVHVDNNPQAVNSKLISSSCARQAANLRQASICSAVR
jgi:hypothetical protein